MRSFRALLFSLLFAAATSVLAAPTQNVTATTYETIFGPVTIAAEPRGRGTFAIAFTCSAVFFFCVWTSVHPNIMPGVSSDYRTYYKFMFMLVSLIVPEGVIVCAFGQWRTAKQIHAAWRKQLGLPELTWVDTLLFWRTSDDGLDLEGAFFVVMGGFVVNLQAADSTAITTLTPYGFLRFLQQGYIHPRTVNKRMIQDKGKSSNIAKLVATSQALWLLVQCLARWMSQLRFTLLEVHVGIQVICTIIVCALWWSKPLDVNDPIPIVLQKDFAGNWERPSLAPSDFDPEDLKTTESLLLGNVQTQSFITLQPPACLTAVRAKAYHDLVMPIVHPSACGFVKKSAWRRLLAEGLLIFTTGALHALAWNLHFPSDPELWLWRGSSVVMCVFPWALGIILYWTQYHRDLMVVIWKMQFGVRGYWRCISDALHAIHDTCVRRGKDSWLGVFRHYVLVLVCLILLSCYGFAVVFITVEAYISLRNPPDGAFSTPMWVDYWPRL